MANYLKTNSNVCRKRERNPGSPHSPRVLPGVAGPSIAPSLWGAPATIAGRTGALAGTSMHGQEWAIGRSRFSVGSTWMASSIAGGELAELARALAAARSGMGRFPIHILQFPDWIRQVVGQTYKLDRRRNMSLTVRLARSTPQLA